MVESFRVPGVREDMQRPSEQLRSDVGTLTSLGFVVLLFRGPPVDEGVCCGDPGWVDVCGVVGLDSDRRHAGDSPAVNPTTVGMSAHLRVGDPWIRLGDAA